MLDLLVIYLLLGVVVVLVMEALALWLGLRPIHTDVIFLLLAIVGWPILLYWTLTAFYWEIRE